MNPPQETMNTTQTLPGAYPIPITAGPISAQEYLAMVNQTLQLAEGRRILRRFETQGLEKRRSRSPLEDVFAKRKARNVDRVPDNENWYDNMSKYAEHQADNIVRQADQEVTKDEVARLLQSVSLEGQDLASDLDQYVMVQKTHFRGIVD